MILNMFCAQAQQTVPLFYEKVFIHTDRDVYAQGEDIWFKAYLVDAQNNKPINYSRNLYVELISPSSKSIMFHAVRLEGGLGTGDFKLADTLSAGIYRIRAYTNWMRNFGDSFIFEKNITIINTDGKVSGINAVVKPFRRLKGKPVPAGRPDTIPTGPLVRFFPEGGSLVNDVTSLVAVKAENAYGKGIAVSGVVLASSDRVVAKFTCDSLGMGSFNLTPDATQDYHAEVVIAGEKRNFKVRPAERKGFILGVNHTSPFIVAEINCNNFTLNESAGSNLIIVARHAGKTIYKEQIRIQQKDIVIQIPDGNFPDGIAAVTVYDERLTPLSERLVYIHHPNGVKLVLSTDKTVYQPKEKVTVKIKLNDTTRAHLSFAAVDANVAGIQTENIASYLELRSEIKGSIEHPERYFDTVNINRFKQMDLLLLTQGWRDFVWKGIEKAKFTLRYDIEQALTITGRVRRVWANKPMQKMNITMFAPKATGDKLFYTESDSSGKFKIDGAVIFGYQYINFNSRASMGITADGTSMGKTGGYIKVDSLFQDRLAINTPLVLMQDTTAINADLLLARQKFTFSGINPLKTVQVKSNGISEVYPPEVHPITAAEHKEYGSLGHYLIYMIPGAHMEFGGCSGGLVCQNEYKDPGLSLLETGYCDAHNVPITLQRVSIRGTYTDHSKLEPACDNDYLGLPISSVLKVTINHRETGRGVGYSVNVVMRPGVLGMKDIFDNTMADVVGYTKARTFFKPRYEAPEDKPDYRTTIHWEPGITTDAKGEATISFYNADPKTKVHLLVQGITDKGVPVVATAAYLVK
jgi:hypothetical protein